MEPITQNFRFSAVLQVEIPVAEPYVVGSIREYLHLRHLKFGELPTKEICVIWRFTIPGINSIRFSINLTLFGMHQSIWYIPQLQPC